MASFRRYKLSRYLLKKQTLYAHRIRAASDTGTFSNDTVLDRRAVATHMLLCTMLVASVYSIANFLL